MSEEEKTGKSPMPIRDFFGGLSWRNTETHLNATFIPGFKDYQIEAVGIEWDGVKQDVLGILSESGRDGILLSPLEQEYVGNALRDSLRTPKPVSGSPIVTVDSSKVLTVLTYLNSK